MRFSLLVFTVLLGFVSCTKSDKSQSTEPNAEPVVTVPADVNTALQRNTCLACHKLDRKLIGPSYLDIAQKMTSPEEIVSLIRNPNPEHWPSYPPMAGIQINETDGVLIGNWIMGLKK